MDSHKAQNSTLLRWARLPAPGFRLYCFPFSGGSASFFAPWQQQTPDWLEVVGVQYPGHETRIGRPFARSWTELVADIAGALAADLDGTPFALFGHSMGALVAIETAYRLGHRARAKLVFASACQAPCLAVAAGDTHAVSDDELLARVASYGGMPPAIMDEPELRQLFLPVLRADYRLLDAYTWRQRPPLPVPIEVLGGTEDSLVDEEGLRAWQQHTSAGACIRPFPGGHFFINESRAAVLDLIARRVSSFLPQDG